MGKKEDKIDFEDFNKGDEFNGEIIGQIFYRRKTHMIYCVKGIYNISYASKKPKGGLAPITEHIKVFNQKLPRDIDKKRFNYDLATTIHLCFSGEVEKGIESAKALKEDIIAPTIKISFKDGYFI